MRNESMTRWIRGVLAGAVIAASNAAASPQLYGVVKELWINDGANSNIAYIMVGTTAFSSSCGSTSGYMVMDLSEAGMKEAYAMALSAFMAGVNVRAAGIGACHGVHEKLKWIYLAQ